MFAIEANRSSANVSPSCQMETTITSPHMYDLLKITQKRCGTGSHSELKMRFSRRDVGLSGDLSRIYRIYLMFLSPLGLTVFFYLILSHLATKLKRQIFFCNEHWGRQYMSLRDTVAATQTSRRFHHCIIYNHAVASCCYSSLHTCSLNEMWVLFPAWKTFTLINYSFWKLDSTLFKHCS